MKRIIIAAMLIGIMASCSDDGSDSDCIARSNQLTEKINTIRRNIESGRIEAVTGIRQIADLDKELNQLARACD